MKQITKFLTILMFFLLLVACQKTNNSTTSVVSSSIDTTSSTISDPALTTLPTSTEPISTTLPTSTEPIITTSSTTIPTVTSTIPVEKPFSDYAKNVILLIGDGMGENQVKVSEMIYDDIIFNYESLISKGYLKTSAYDGSVTDSAAGGTALATGHKTNSRIVGKSFDKSESYPNILEIAHEHGLKTGLITDVSLYDATPATFSTHVNDRYYNRDVIITNQINNNFIDYIMGLDPSMYYTQQTTIENNGYDYLTSRQDLLASTSSKIFGLFEKVSNTDERYPNLSEMVEKALSTLHNEKGFVLVVEAGNIDKVISSGNVNILAENVLEMDKTIGVILEFMKNNKDTLLLVTADHETGGLIIGDGEPDSSWFTATNYSHTATNVPLKAYGAYEKFISSEIVENTEVFNMMLNALQIVIEK